jgi:REP element-mobilizing transposase RayT
MPKKTTGNRKSIRLDGYNYSYPGYYFITINAHRRIRRFGQIRNRVMHMSDQGVIVHEVLVSLAQVYEHVDMDAFVVMPDHIHFIIRIRELRSIPQWNFSGTDEEYRLSRRRMIIPTLVGRLKMQTSKRIHEHSRDFNPVWQRNYYERLIPDDEILRRTRLYILNNPLNWRS